MRNEEFLSLLNTVDFPRRYWELCERHPIRACRSLESGWKEAIFVAFHEMGVVPKYDSRDRSFACEEEWIGDYLWSGLFCKMRKSGLELILSGRSGDSRLGSNFAVLAYDAKRLADPTFARDRFAGPPPYPRPADNGDLGELKEVVTEFVILVRLVKDAIRTSN